MQHRHPSLLLLWTPPSHRSHLTAQLSSHDGETQPQSRRESGLRYGKITKVLFAREMYLLDLEQYITIEQTTHLPCTAIEMYLQIERLTLTRATATTDRILRG